MIHLISKNHLSKFFFQVISVISIVFVVASTVGMTLNTVPSVQHRNAEGEPIDNPKLALIEAICISWFTIEYLLRFAGNLVRIHLKHVLLEPFNSIKNMG